MKNFFHNIVVGFVALCSRLPMSVHYFFSGILRFFMYHVAHYRLKIVRENLQRAFPEKTDEERKQIEKKFYKHFCDYIFETLKAMTISKDEVLKRMVIKNPEIINQFNKEGRSVFAYAAHFGNWEWFQTFPFYFPYAEICTFYQPQKSELANKITLYGRSRHSITPVESQKGYRFIVNKRNEGQVTATLIIGDQSPHHGAQKYWTTFFNTDTAFLVGPAQIAKKADIVLIYPSFVSYKRGYYEVEMKLIEANPKDVDRSTIIDRFAALLEEDIQRIPELWLWSHRRWKHKHEDFPDEK